VNPNRLHTELPLRPSRPNPPSLRSSPPLPPSLRSLRKRTRRRSATKRASAATGTITMTMTRIPLPPAPLRPTTTTTTSLGSVRRLRLARALQSARPTARSLFADIDDLEAGIDGDEPATTGCVTKSGVLCLVVFAFKKKKKKKKQRENRKTLILV
jgi:hypothetical protein